MDGQRAKRCSKRRGPAFAVPKWEWLPKPCALAIRRDMRGRPAAEAGYCKFGFWCATQSAANRSLQGICLFCGDLQGIPRFCAFRNRRSQKVSVVSQMVVELFPTSAIREILARIREYAPRRAHINNDSAATGILLDRRENAAGALPLTKERERLSPFRAFSKAARDASKRSPIRRSGLCVLTSQARLPTASFGEARYAACNFYNRRSPLPT